MVGEWGYGVFENDIALDVEQAIASMMKREGLSLQDGANKLLSSKPNLENNEIVLAVAQLEYETYGEVRHIDDTIRAVKSELTEELLNEWGFPQKRKDVLIEFAKQTNINLD